MLHYYFIMFLHSLFLKAHFEVVELVDICISNIGLLLLCSFDLLML